MRVFTKSFFHMPEVKIEEEKKDVRFDAMVIGVFKEDVKISPLLQEIINLFPNIFDRIERTKFGGDPLDHIHLSSTEFELFVVGLGSKLESINTLRENIRRASSHGCLRARDSACEHVLLVGFEHFEREAIEGALLGLYEFKALKSSEKEKKIKSIHILSKNKNRTDIEQIVACCEAQNFARDIVNLPGNHINPSTLAEIASAVAEEYGLMCRIYDEDEIRKMGMEGVIAVGKGSTIPPKFVHIWWKPREPKDKIAFIGKAITFDSGGLSLKPPASMINMKADKSGAASVIATMKVIGLMKPPVEVHGIFAACENMPSGSAQRPGDIIRTMSGKTVEVENTDAEGRLTLVDAIEYVQRLGVKKIIDTATLTGACMIALGEYTAGIMGNSEDFIDFVCKTGNELGEKMWILPFDRDLRDKLKSHFADLKNVGDSYGGAITAGMFMAEFVEKDVKWVHIDIAGPAFINREIGYFSQKGGTGFGVRTFVEIVKKMSEGVTI